VKVQGFFQYDKREYFEAGKVLYCLSRILINEKRVDKKS
jgi:hypothetical protein